ncbi:MAG: TIGR03905 family TSCPD domain-containing protein [Lawsonibacter sp.]|nr:TIGR03905 family TSCPD domain-containing protein [Lawsonibacter sp.]
MTITYKPKGVCSKKFTIEVENGVVQSLEAVGGCNGNLQGLSTLLRGMKVEDVVARMEGIRCGMKSTSCPDQIAQALKTAM